MGLRRSDRWRHAAVALYGAIAIALPGCWSDRTEIIVVVDTDLAVPGEVDNFVVEVTSPDGRQVQRAIASLTDGTPRPRFVGVAHEGGVAGPFRFRAAARRGGGVDVVERRAITSFRKGRTLMLQLNLLRPCVNVSCAADQTCVGGTCQSATISPLDLPEWSSLPDPIAASAPRDSGLPPPPADGGGTCVPRPEACDGLDNNCNGMIDDGFHLEMDPENCGSCGNVCRAPMRDCVGGVCM